MQEARLKKRKLSGVCTYDTLRGRLYRCDAGSQVALHVDCQLEFSSSLRQSYLWEQLSRLTTLPNHMLMGLIRKGNFLQVFADKIAFVKIRCYLLVDGKYGSLFLRFLEISIKYIDN